MISDMFTCIIKSCMAIFDQYKIMQVLITRIITENMYIFILTLGSGRAGSWTRSSNSRY
jgi:hypothetical protein